MPSLRIDAHQHFWRYRPEDYPWIGPEMALLQRDYGAEDLAPHLEHWRLDGSIAVQARAAEAETDALLAIAAAEPRVLAVVGWVDLTAPDLERRLERWEGQAALAGFREMIQDAADPAALMADETFQRGVAVLQERGLVYEVLIHARDLPAAVRFCARHDRARLVLDHLGKPAIATGERREWARHLRALARMPHVHAKLSGLVTEADWSTWSAEQLRPYLETALEAFGPQRLMFGSDWPVCRLAATYDQVAEVVDGVTGALSPDERAAIWGGTAARCYRIGG